MYKIGDVIQIKVVEGTKCKDCFFYDLCITDLIDLSEQFPCEASDREDGKSVIYQAIKPKNETDSKPKPPLLEDALKVLGWQGGTIHQVLDVLRCAKRISDQYHESQITGEWGEFASVLTSLRYIMDN